jgi:large subunit ribosomal protein L24
MALKIKKDDNVRVISGKSKGRTGRVLRVDVKNERVYVEGANIVKRHQRPTTLRDTQRGSQVSGGVIEKEGPIHISNVMLLDPKSGDPTRVRVSREGGQRKRTAARSGEPID